MKRFNIAAIALSLLISTLLMPSSMASGISIEISPRTTDVNAGSLINVAVTGLGQEEGIYALLCKDSTTTPVICDQTQARWLVNFLDTPGQSVNSANLKVKSVFDGKVSRAAAEVTVVDCRVDNCVIYIRPDHRIPTKFEYARKYPLTLLPSEGNLLTDYATYTINANKYTFRDKPQITYNSSVIVESTADSNIPVSLQVGDGNCAVNGNTVTALTGRGECTVKAVTSGNGLYNPLNLTYTFKLKRAKQSIEANWVAPSKFVKGNSLQIRKKDFQPRFKSKLVLKSQSQRVCKVSERGKVWLINVTAIGECQLSITAKADKQRWTRGVATATYVVLN